MNYFSKTIINSFKNHMMYRKIAAGILSLASVFVLSPSAWALTNDTNVINSGDNASISSSTSQNSSTSVSNNNTATVTQDISANANTGYNSVDKNISLGGAGASINTGGAQFGANMQVQANQNTTSLGMSTPTGTNSTSLVNTGDNTNLNTNVNTNDTISVFNSNNANAAQTVNADANTGFNSASSNIGGGQITTGGASMGVGFNAALNNNATSIGGMMPTAATLGNGTSLTNTGDNAYINTNASSNNSVSVANYNNAAVAQDIYASSNTGYNSGNSNIGGSSIFTGGTGLGVNMQTAANSNWTGISGMNTFAPMNVNLGDFVNTGDHLHASTNVNSNTSNSVYNANSLYSTQASYATSNSGFNSAASNIGGMNTLMTGGAGFGTGMTTRANGNWTVFGMSIPSSITGIFGL